MKTDLHLVFPGKCREAFAFYEKTFNTKVSFTMTFGEAPEGSPVPPDSKDLIMHTSMPLGSITLMGCDAPKGREATLGGFQISVSDDQHRRSRTPLRRAERRRQRANAHRQNLLVAALRHVHR